MRKIKLVTTDPKLPKWKSLERKKLNILNALNAGKNANFTAFDIEYIAGLTPIVTKEKKLEHKWLNGVLSPYFNQGYDFAGLHFSIERWLRVGLDRSLRGANPIDSNLLGEFYVRGNENTRRRYAPRGAILNQIEQTILHEIIHEYFRGSGLKDITHEFHYTNGDIRELLKTLDWSLYRPNLVEYRKTEATLKDRLAGLVAQLKQKLANPTPAPAPFTPTALLPLVQQKANAIVAEMKRLGHEVRIVEGFRSIERQNQLYAQGRTTPGSIVTNARGGESLHNYGVAVDFVFRKEGYNASDTLWSLLGKVGKLQGFEWGGDWKGFVDRPHFELKLGYSLKDFQTGKVDYKKFNI